MIRINLLEKQRQAAPAKAGPQVTTTGAMQTVIVVLIFVAGALFLGYQWTSFNRRLSNLKTELAAADQELADLNKVLKTMDQHQAKKKALEQRVGLISDLKRRQNVPVQLLDMLSRQVPEFLWLEGLDEKSGAISLKGKATTKTAVSNFYNNLRDSNYFSELALGAVHQAPEGVSFQLSCRFAPPISPVSPPPPTPAGEATPAPAEGTPPTGDAAQSAPPRG